MLVFLSSLNLLWCQSDVDTQFASANALYESGNLEEAIKTYESLAVTYGNRQLEYNLANSYYRTGQIPKAILHYERALRYAPENEDVIYNLNRARLQTVDKMESEDSNRFSQWWKSKLMHVGADSWANISILLAILTLALAALFLFGKSAMRRFGFSAGFATLVLCFICFWFSLSAKSAQLATSEAIILTAKVEVMSAPNDSAKELFILHEGSKVSVLRESDAWMEIKLSNGEVGWLKSSDMEII